VTSVVSSEVAAQLSTDPPNGAFQALRQLVESARSRAGDLDAGRASARDLIPELAHQGLLALGAPNNSDGRLAEMAEVLSCLGAECLSTAFSVWADRMVIEYLALADTDYSRAALEPLFSGEQLGVTGMASAFRELAGCGKLDLSAEPIPGGYRLTGRIRWASNLYPDSLLVSAARTTDGRRLVVALPLATPGVTASEPFTLMALGSTASAYVDLGEVSLPEEQVLSEDFEGFLTSVRPTFLILQTAFCLGLAGRCLGEALRSLKGVNEVFAEPASQLADRLRGARSDLVDLAARVGSSEGPSRQSLLRLRLAGAELADQAAALELRSAGGGGYATGAAANRRYREAAFIPVQSPSEAQLRWELSQRSCED
jgi:alkylation response protein AidB-like acyl-CoA dehydrogenase